MFVPTRNKEKKQKIKSLVGTNIPKNTFAQENNVPTEYPKSRDKSIFWKVCTNQKPKNNPKNSFWLVQTSQKILLSHDFGYSARTLYVDCYKIKLSCTKVFFGMFVPTKSKKTD